MFESLRERRINRDKPALLSNSSLRERNESRSDPTRSRGENRGRFAVGDERPMIQHQYAGRKPGNPFQFMLDQNDGASFARRVFERFP